MDMILFGYIMGIPKIRMSTDCLVYIHIYDIKKKKN